MANEAPYYKSDFTLDSYTAAFMEAVKELLNIKY